MNKRCIRRRRARVPPEPTAAANLPPVIRISWTPEEKLNHPRPFKGAVRHKSAGTLYRIGFRSPIKGHKRVTPPQWLPSAITADLFLLNCHLLCSIELNVRRKSILGIGLEGRRGELMVFQ